MKTKHFLQRRCSSNYILLTRGLHLRECYDALKEDRISFFNPLVRQGVLDTTLSDKVCQ
jgi:hypothetical protein